MRNFDKLLVFFDSLPIKIKTLELINREIEKNEKEAIDSLKRIISDLREKIKKFNLIEIEKICEQIQENSSANELKPLIEKLIILLKEIENHNIENLKKILIIEDDIKIIIPVKKKLENINYFVLTAGNKEEAEKIIKQTKIDLIILDIYLKDSDGRNFLLELKNDILYNNIPVITISATTSELVKSECLSLGAEHFLEKPVNLEQIVELIEKIFIEKSKHMVTEGYDFLTKLPNRALFYKMYKELVSLGIRENKQCCISILDLDDFKNINDEYGHNKGDIVLKEFAELMKNNVRSSDLITRWGGEEFIIFFYDTLIEDARFRLEKLLDIFSKKNFQFNSNEIYITFSAGLATIDYNKTIEDNIALADKKLYMAKETGKKKIVIDNNIQLETKKRILIADDDEMILNLLEYKLSSENFEVIRFEDGKKALEYLETNLPMINIFILDINMPIMDGIELLKNIRKIKEYQKAPVIILSALDSEKYIVEGFDSGADDYVVKPFSSAELTARIRRLLRKK